MSILPSAYSRLVEGQSSADLFLDCNGLETPIWWGYHSVAWGLRFALKDFEHAGDSLDA